MVKHFDVCIICFNYISIDARALNLANALVDLNQKVAVISFDEVFDYEFRFQHYPIKIDKSRRLAVNLLLFIKAYFTYSQKLTSNIIVSSDFYSLHVAYLFKKKFKSKLIYDSREIYSKLGKLDKERIKQKIISSIELLLVKRVDLLTVSGDLDSEYLKSYLPYKKEYYTILNLPYYKPKVESDLIRNYFKLPHSKKIILYQGILIKGRGILPAISAMSKLEDYVLVIIGETSPYLDDIRKFAKLSQVEDRVYYKEKVDYTSLHEWTCSADIGIALFEDISLSYKYALPNKLFEYAMAGLPVIASDLPAMKLVTTGYNFVNYIEYPFDVNNLVIQIKLLTENYDKFRKSAIQFAEKYNYENQIDAIKKVFEVK